MTLVTDATTLPRLMRCIGSRLMPRAIPADYDTSGRDEGTAAHWLAQALFEGQHVPVGTKSPNGYVITDDMIEHVNGYLSALDAGDMEVETTFTGQSWEVRARADHIFYRNTGELVIDDFKYGWRIVEPYENYTLIAHAIGWCIRNNTRPDTITLRIHQPRPYHSDGPCRSWSINYDQLMHYWTMIDARLSNPTDELVTGPQCAKCPARYDCPAFDRATYNAIDVSLNAFHDDVSDDVLAMEYDTFAQAELYIKIAREAREELMTYRLRSGNVIQGWHLKQRQGQRAWITGLTGKALSAAAGVDLTKDGLVTPAEAERRGVDKAVVASLTSRPVIGHKLERLDADAHGRRVFGDVG